MRMINEKEAFELSLDIGAAMIKSGGEIHRVEDTVRRINESFGARGIEVSALPSLIIATVILSDDVQLTSTRRVKNELIDMSEVDRLNSLSRRICSGDRSFIELTKGNEYSPVINFIAVIIATGAFCIYFGGSYFDALVASLIGVAITYVRPSLTLTDFASTLFDSVVAGVLSFLPSMLNIPSHPDKIMIGTIMLLVPGLTVADCARDIVSGDIIAGILRLVSAVFTALAIAFGYSVGVAVFGWYYF